MEKPPPIDLEAVRADTPGVADCIHFNNAGAGLMPLPVIEAVKDHLDLEARIGGYEAKAQENERIEAAYRSVARLIGADTSEIAFAENASVAWQWAFFAQDLQQGDRILTAEAEYAANYIAYLQMAKRTGCVIEVIPSDGSGATDPQALERMIDARVKLIAVTWIPTNGGLMNPVAEIGEIARAHGVPYLLDACQAVGQTVVDVGDLGCDYLSATGRKFLRAPRGCGFLYVKRDRLNEVEPYMLDLFGATWTAPDSYEMRADARRFESFESSLALHLGLGAAAEYAMGIGVDAIEHRAFGLAAELREQLAELPGVTVQDIGAKKCAIATFSHDRVPADEIVAKLREKKINVHRSRASSTLLDATARSLPDLVRVSPHYYNADEDVVSFIQSMKSILA